MSSAPRPGSTPTATICIATVFRTRAFSVPVEPERRLYFFVLTRFLQREPVSTSLENALFEQRRARHEGVERRPELQAVAVLLLQDFVLRAGDDQMRAGAQMIGELLDRRGRDDGVVAGGQHQDRLANLRGIVGSTEAAHRAEGGIGPGYRRR